MQSVFTLWLYFSLLKYNTYKYLEACDCFLDTGDMTIVFNLFKLEIRYIKVLLEHNQEILNQNIREIDTNISLKNIDYEVLNKKVYDFIYCLKSKMSEENYNLLIKVLSNNLINSYEIKDNISKLKMILNGTAGTVSYDSKKELFEYYLGFNFKSIQKNVPFHELFHLSSIYKKIGNKTICGFRLPNGFGRMLNEGYTEHLTRKYFLNNSNEIKTASLNYYISENISSILEEIIGFEYMEKCYLNADINGLILLMNKYISNEESYDLIYNLDIISNDDIAQILYKSSELYCYQNINLRTMYNKVMYKYDYKLYNIEKTLIKMYIVKLSKENNLSKDTIVNKVIDFYDKNFSNLKNINSIYKTNKDFILITMDEILNIINDTLKEKEKYIIYN